MRAKIRLRQHWGESKKERLVNSSPKGKIGRKEEGKGDRRDERGREEEGGTSQCA